eukprot:11293-Heterococcus_DN1.PRE.1
MTTRMSQYLRQCGAEQKPWAGLSAVPGAATSAVKMDSHLQPGLMGLGHSRPVAIRSATADTGVGFMHRVPAYVAPPVPVGLPVPIMGRYTTVMKPWGNLGAAGRFGVNTYDTTAKQEQRSEPTAGAPADMPRAETDSSSSEGLTDSVLRQVHIVSRGAIPPHLQVLAQNLKAMQESKDTLMAVQTLVDFQENTSDKDLVPSYRPGTEVYYGVSRTKALSYLFNKIKEGATGVLGF